MKRLSRTFVRLPSHFTVRPWGAWPQGKTGGLTAPNPDCSFFSSMRPLALPGGTAFGNALLESAPKRSGPE